MGDLSDFKGAQGAGGAPPESLLETGPICSNGDIYYFAIGSMINPTSLNSRKVFPSVSVPAVLEGWALKFTGKSGMATSVFDGESSFHGVVHQVSSSEMEVLDAIESSYDRVLADATLYNGRTVNVYVYSRLGTNSSNAQQMGKAWDLSSEHPPSERYIDIITRGCKHYGVSQVHIDWLFSLETTPRKERSAYLSFTVPENAKKYSTMFLKRQTGQNGARLVLSINGKLLEHTGNASQGHWKFATKHGGQEIAYKMSSYLFEPAFGDPPACYEHMSEQHREWCVSVCVYVCECVVQCIVIHCSACTCTDLCVCLHMYAYITLMRVFVHTFMCIFMCVYFNQGGGHVLQLHGRASRVHRSA
jgi:hypothetical protein